MNNDLISRDALKETIRKRLCVSSLEYLTEQEKVIVEEIDNAPTVDLWQMRQEATENALKKAEVLYARPKGNWNYIQVGMCVCPFCGAMPHKLYKNYCAKCGAELKGGAE